jgi:hypothetical protein
VSQIEAMKCGNPFVVDDVWPESAADGPHAGEELFDVEGLGVVVVSASFRGDDLVAAAGSAGEGPSIFWCSRLSITATAACA